MSAEWVALADFCPLDGNDVTVQEGDRIVECTFALARQLPFSKIQMMCFFTVSTLR
jgi:hypothetical protein